MDTHDEAVHDRSSGAAPSARRRTLLALLGLFALVVALGHLRTYAREVPFDFEPFYCGGKVVLQHGDPYRVQPLLACERQFDPGAADVVAIPVPLPGYAFAPLALLAALPVQRAVELFGALMLAAALWTAYCVSRMSRLPPAVAFAAVFMATTYSAATVGQITPFAVAGVAGAALLVRRGRMRSAALAASVALLQPQFGLPVVLALLLFVPRTRAVLGAVIAGCAAASLVLLGARGTFEYLAVLRVQAASEMHATFAQYGLPWLLHALGMAAGPATAVGTAAYAVAVVLTLVVVGRHRAACIANGGVVLIPVTAVLFATYLHGQHLTVVALTALVLVRPAPRALSPLLAAALFIVPFIRFPTMGLKTIPTMVLALVAVWCVVYFGTEPLGRRVALRGAGVTTAVVVLCTAVLFALRPHRLDWPIPLLRHDPAALAGTEWAAFEEYTFAHDPTPLAIYLMPKVPLWLGAGLTIWFAAGALGARGSLSATAGDTNPRA